MLESAKTENSLSFQKYKLMGNLLNRKRLSEKMLHGIPKVSTVECLLKTCMSERGLLCLGLSDNARIIERHRGNHC
mgnify:CR=1 FL=1